MDTTAGPVPRRELRAARRHPDHDGDGTSGRPRPPSALTRPVPTLLAGPAPAGASGGPAPLRRRASGDDPLGGQAVPEAIETVLRRRRGTGTPLPDSIAQDLGAGLGADLSEVRVHTDPEAARITRQLHAVAFTRGPDIYFGTGAYQPESAAGRELLAHELAHVVQQGRPTPGSGPADVIGRADDPAERQADDLAAQVVRRRRTALPEAKPGPASGQRPAGRPALRRYPVDRKNAKANRLLRERYINVKDPDDAGHYGDEFDVLVTEKETIQEMEVFVTKLETDKAARKIVVPVTPVAPAPAVITPAVVVPAAVPVASAGPAKKEKPKSVTFTVGPAPYVAKVEPVVDPYTGLSPAVRSLAQQITAWPTNVMDGTAATLSLSEQATLRAWVESRTTPSGKQKYVVNIGPGTGKFSAENQFKVTGFGSVGGKAPTFHITL